jgi:ubiquinone/menaquinone biosynthesis C-methylase UbiE
MTLPPVKFAVRKRSAARSRLRTHAGQRSPGRVGAVLSWCGGRGGAGHQSFPLAQAGYDVTLLDPSPAMLDKARQRLQLLPGEVQRGLRLLAADGENAD